MAAKRKTYPKRARWLASRNEQAVIEALLNPAYNAPRDETYKADLEEAGFEVADTLIHSESHFRYIMFMYSRILEGFLSSPHEILARPQGFMIYVRQKYMDSETLLDVFKLMEALKPIRKQVFYFEENGDTIGLVLIPFFNPLDESSFRDPNYADTLRDETAIAEQAYLESRTKITNSSEVNSVIRYVHGMTPQNQLIARDAERLRTEHKVSWTKVLPLLIEELEKNLRFLRLKKACWPVIENGRQEMTPKALVLCLRIWCGVTTRVNKWSPSPTDCLRPKPYYIVDKMVRKVYTWVMANRRKQQKSGRG